MCKYELLKYRTEKQITGYQKKGTLAELNKSLNFLSPFGSESYSKTICGIMTNAKSCDNQKSCKKL